MPLPVFMHHHFVSCLNRLTRVLLYFLQYDTNTDDLEKKDGRNGIRISFAMHLCHGMSSLQTIDMMSNTLSTSLEFNHCCYRVFVATLIRYTMPQEKDSSSLKIAIPFS